MADFTGKTALITGSGRGMGRSHAAILAARGAAVVIHDINEAWAEETARRIRDKGGRCLVACGDVSKPGDMQDVVRRGEAEFGGIDILINNAGISAERAGLDGITEDLYERMFGVHVKGTIFTTQAAVPGMIARRSGRIVNISSIWGMTGHHFGATYCAAKAAILGLTKAWAKEFAPHNICVNAVAPGAVKTEMQVEVDGLEAVKAQAKAIPLGRLAEPEEMSYPVIFLASSEASFVTGQVLSPNGGDTIVGV
ncbi:3-oxoacyl-[acyl-carrier protein] reductase [Rhodoligotrophos appendicifer]|uniref:SDR family NAD(P)-dependent oxidoreductase n=1 Tax=Rhodoligotrophos appendicifer TaxID=987056 RepID=UPI001185C351|nr:glucose 1-dehydrogenase [Rhodoligotrophos appendicifer]